MKKTILFLLTISLSLAASAAQREVNIIPKPTEVRIEASGDFTLSGKTTIYLNSPKATTVADMLALRLGKDYRVEASVKNARTPKSGVNFMLSDKFAEEQYRMTVASDRIVIEGSESGLFYGLQSLLQLLPQQQSATIAIPCLTIDDKPRFAYRGVMLDAGRYFYNTEYVKRFIDLAATYKINTFHWHLTEDGGWRPEIRKYPQLTYNGAYRRGTQTTRDKSIHDRLPAGGFYTQEEMKQVVEYAKARNVTVIPEIDLPGHTMALLASFPELSCRGERIIPTEHWDIQADVLCLGNPDTYRVIFDILDEIAEIFPSKIIHIGGDEAPKGRWKECPKCQAKIKELGLKDEHELQSYFIQQLERHMAAKGRKILGWDEILEGGLAPGAMVMSWRGEQGGIAAAKMGHEVVMAPTTHMYHDYYQGNPADEPLNIFERNVVPLKKVYLYEPRSEKIPQESHKFVVGVQSNMWCEYIHTEEKLEYMTYPRLLATAEIGWSAPDKDWDDFRHRMKTSLGLLDKHRVNYRIPEPIGFEGGEFGEKEITVVLEEPLEGAVIFISTDGRDPLQYGQKYTRPIRMQLAADKPGTLKCVVKTRQGRVSGTYTATYVYKGE